MAPILPRLAAALLLVCAGIAPAAARTDLAGCVSTEVPYMTKYRSLLWYDPDTGEICELIDCGGGRAPPKTTVPGCPLYEGTETVTPKYWTGFAAGPTSVVIAATTTTTSAVPVETESTATSAVYSERTGVAESSSPRVTSGPVSATSASGVPTKITTITTVISTVGADASSTGADSGSQSGSSSTASTAGAVPTGLGKGLVGVLAGAAAAGLVLL
ncbi:hypothetical protein VTK56DRAFT_5319 [Thermocarpiscus australiensis]